MKSSAGRCSSVLARLLRGGAGLAVLMLAVLVQPAAAAQFQGSAREGSKLVITVNTRHLLHFSVRWSYRTVSGSATAGDDFEPVSGRLEFGPGEYKKSVSVQTLKDCLKESREFVVLKFHDFQVKGYYRGFDGWMTPPVKFVGLPAEWQVEGEIIDVYNHQDNLRRGCE